MDWPLRYRNKTKEPGRFGVFLKEVDGEFMFLYTTSIPPIPFEGRDKRYFVFISESDPDFGDTPFTSGTYVVIDDAEFFPKGKFSSRPVKGGELTSRLEAAIARKIKEFEEDGEAWSCVTRTQDPA